MNVKHPGCQEANAGPEPSLEKAITGFSAGLQSTGFLCPLEAKIKEFSGALL